MISVLTVKWQLLVYSTVEIHPHEEEIFVNHAHQLDLQGGIRVVKLIKEVMLLITDSTEWGFGL